MKKIVFFSMMMLMAVVAFAQTPVRSNSTTPVNSNAAFSWKTTTTYDFGQIPQGTPVTYEFAFTNNGSAPLIIQSVSASCGCTATDYSKEPIAPGKTGYVKATYNAANPGPFSKSVTVNANVEGGSVMLQLKGEVVHKNQ